ncbi:hypothetical protein HY483_02015 [Candidatus Woesearchaeota archaeon]|nr:hypothetical protein [Candidatus Woesearchaeota archaeon]
MSVKQKIIEKHERKKIAIEEIAELFKKAENASQVMADRCVLKAQKMAQRANIRLTREFKRKYCKHCNSHIKTGTSARIRTRNGMLIIYCYKCKKFTKQALKEKLQNKR